MEARIEMKVYKRENFRAELIDVLIRAARNYQCAVDDGRDSKIALQKDLEELRAELIKEELD